jgi:integrase
MSRALNRLTAREVASFKEPGRYADGGGLYLRLTKAGSRSWVFMSTRDEKRVEIGLGATSMVPLAAARQIAEKMREAIAVGQDPRLILKPATTEAAPIPTFGKYAESYIASVEAGWKNEVHRQQWRSSLRDHASAIADKPIDAIDTEDVLAVLNPIWLTKAETARRLRGRIERILDAAKVRGLRSRDSVNPATWRGHLALLMPAQSRLARGHHPALPWKEVPAFMSALRVRTAIAARCLEFVILTAARSGEALGATWQEIDWKEKVWTVPATRMKAGVEHVVPLSGAAIAVLRSVQPKQPQPAELIFALRGPTRSNMAMTMLLRRMGYGHITTHGFRSTFRDWAGDHTNFPREIIEQALAHTIQNAAERAYRRGTALERRRELMSEWAKYLVRP